MCGDSRLISSDRRLSAAFKYVDAPPFENVIDSERTVRQRRRGLRTSLHISGRGSIEMILGMRDHRSTVCVSDVESKRRGSGGVSFPAPGFMWRQRHLPVERGRRSMDSNMHVGNI